MAELVSCALFIFCALSCAHTNEHFWDALVGGERTEAWAGEGGRRFSGNGSAGRRDDGFVECRHGRKGAV